MPQPTDRQALCTPQVLVPGVYGILVTLETCAEGRAFRRTPGANMSFGADTTLETEISWSELTRIDISWGCPLIQESWCEPGTLKGHAQGPSCHCAYSNAYSSA